MSLLFPCLGSYSDLYFSSVKSLLHFTGAPGSTTFTDQIVGVIWANTSTPTISSTQFKFSGSSGYFNPGGSYITTTTNLSPLTNDFTIEAFIYPTSNTQTHEIFGQTTNGISFGTTSGQKLQISQAFVALRLTGATTIANNTWQHVATTRQGNTLRLFLNGILDASTTNTNNFSASSASWGGYSGTSSTGTMLGYMAECRLTLGVARYTANFIPPTAPFPNY